MSSNNFFRRNYPYLRVIPNERPEMTYSEWIAFGVKFGYCFGVSCTEHGNTSLCNVTSKDGTSSLKKSYDCKFVLELRDPW